MCVEWLLTMMTLMMFCRMYLLRFGMDSKISGKIVNFIHGYIESPPTKALLFWNSKKKKSAVSLSDIETGLANKVTADKNFDANRLEWKLQLAIQQLPEKQKLVFNLRYYDEMPYEEMSKVLETSEGALKASYHHAVKKIEDFIKNN